MTDGSKAKSFGADEAAAQLAADAGNKLRESGIEGTLDTISSTAASRRTTHADSMDGGLAPRDDQYLSRGLHEFEMHHPLMEGETYRQFWKDHGLDNADVERWTVPLDVDIHGGITNFNPATQTAGWWETELFGRIAREEAMQSSALLTKDQVIQIAQELFEEVALGWKP